MQSLALNSRNGRGKSLINKLCQLLLNEKNRTKNKQHEGLKDKVHMQKVMSLNKPIWLNFIRSSCNSTKMQHLNVGLCLVLKTINAVDCRTYIKYIDLSTT